MQAGVRGSQPEVARRILRDGDVALAESAVRLQLVDREIPRDRIEEVEPVVRSNPDASLAIHVHTMHFVVAQAVRVRGIVREGFETLRARVVAREPMREGAEPDRAVVVLREADHHRFECRARRR